MLPEKEGFEVVKPQMTDSATENRPPWATRVRVKTRGKSPRLVQVIA